MNELEFGRPLNGGEELLKEFVSGMMLFKGWSTLKKSVSDKLSEFMPEEHRDIAGLSMEMKFLLLLEVLGPEFRELWGEAAADNYNPQLFREPYLEESKKDALLETLNLIYVTYIDQLMADEKELNFEKNAYFVETKAHYQTILKYKEARSKGDKSVIREDLGSALVAAMTNEDLFVRLLSTPFTPESAYNKSLNDTAEAQHYGLGGAIKTQEELEEEEVRSLVLRYNKETMDDICYHLRGTLLSESLRTEIWAFRFLSRSASEPPNTKNATPGRDYRRLAREKGVDVSRLQALARDADSTNDAGIMSTARLNFDRGFMGGFSSGEDGGAGAGAGAEGDSAASTRMTTLIRESVWAQMQTALSTSVAIAARKQYAKANAAAGAASTTKEDDSPHADRRGPNNNSSLAKEEGDDGERSVATDADAESSAAGAPGEAGSLAREAAERKAGDLHREDGGAGSGSGPAKGAKGPHSRGDGDDGPRSFGGAVDEPFLRKLTRRAEMLVYAGYVLNDNMSSRSINLAILLMRTFPEEPPTSEKILRMYQRLLTECLPSEQLHRQYSLATVAHRAWELLLERDPTLLHFLQNYDIGFDGEGYYDDEDARAEGDEEYDEEDGDGTGEKPLRDGHGRERARSLKPQLSRASAAGETEMPRSLLLLKGWLETGFIGKIPEYAAIYVWDQLTLHGGCPSHFKALLPVLSCVILQALREPIMELPPGIDIIAALHEMGLDLRSRDLVELLRMEGALGPDKNKYMDRDRDGMDAEMDAGVGVGVGRADGETPLVGADGDEDSKAHSPQD